MTQPPAPIHILHLGPWMAAELAAIVPPPYELLPVHAQTDPASMIQAHAHHARALICTSGGTQVTDALLARLPALELILNLGVGTETIDMDAVSRRGIPVLTGAGLNAIDVAELAMGMMLALARRIVVADRDVRALRWGSDTVPVHRLSGRRIGIAGMGAIGKEIGKRAEAFGMSVAYFSRKPATDVAWPYVAKLQDLAAQVDFLFIALPGGGATRHMIDADVLAALGSNGFLINIGRGTTVDESALVRALEQGIIAGAGLDVFEHEPEVSGGLIESDRTVLLPHRGGATVEAQETVLALTLKRLDAHFLGKQQA